MNKVYKLKQNASNPNLYEYEDLGATAPKTTLDDSNRPTLKCSNVLKEIAYTVTVSEKPADNIVSKTAYLSVDKVEADIVMQETPVEAQLNASTGKAMASIHQMFSIKFVKKGNGSVPVQGTSGNPGYIDGLPLLIGTK